jgi:hypothetical protein
MLSSDWYGRPASLESTTQQLEFRSGTQLWDWLVNSNPIAGEILAELDLTEADNVGSGGARRHGPRTLRGERAGRPHRPNQHRHREQVATVAAAGRLNRRVLPHRAAGTTRSSGSWLQVVLRRSRAAHIRANGRGRDGKRQCAEDRALRRALVLPRGKRASRPGLRTRPPRRGPGVRRNTIGCHDAPASAERQQRHLRYRVPCRAAATEPVARRSESLVLSPASGSLAAEHIKPLTAPSDEQGRLVFGGGAVQLAAAPRPLR